MGEIHSGPPGRKELRLYHRFAEPFVGGEEEKRRRGIQWDERLRINAA